MTPAGAFEMQIERYRQMTPAERIELALRLHELASEVARSGFAPNIRTSPMKKWKKCSANGAASPIGYDRERTAAGPILQTEIFSGSA